MFITVASYKGGVGKTTTAVHLAAYLQKLAPTLLIDGDPNHSATTWAKRGQFPFQIVDETEGAYQARNFSTSSLTPRPGQLPPIRRTGEGLRSGDSGCTGFTGYRRPHSDARGNPQGSGEEIPGVAHQGSTARRSQTARNCARH